jgi:serine/threonine protein kinase
MAAGPELPVQPGEVLAGKYRVERILGNGGMGVVVTATHLDLGESRAVKFMLPSSSSDSIAVERFFREARAAASLKSDHVVRVHDVGRMDGGIPFIVMEHLEGTDLGRLIKEQGPLPVSTAVDYLLQACDALAEAHASGIVHRDLKPANLFLAVDADGSKRLKVLDFGISKLAGADPVADITGTDAMIGSPFHMSPEQMRSSRDVDHRTDIWSLGVILYQLLTGSYPFKGDNRLSVMLAVAQEPPAPFSSYPVEVPQALGDAVLRCLDKDRERRFSDVNELAIAIAPFAVAPETTLRLRRIARLSGREAMRGAILGAENTSPGARPSAPSALGDGPTSASWGHTAAQRPSKNLRALSYVGVALAAIGIGVASTRVLSPTPASTTPSAVPVVAQPAPLVPGASAARPAPVAAPSVDEPAPSVTAETSATSSASSVAAPPRRAAKTGTAPRALPPAVREPPAVASDPWGNARK